MPLSETMRSKLQDMVTQHEVILFMKGNRHFPQCGFSAQVVQILGQFLPKFETVNVLADPELREGIKEFSQWPTIPQLYIRGQFVGGCDIVKEMYASGELANALGVKVEPVAAPTVHVTPSAAKAFADAAEPGSKDVVRLAIGPAFEYDLHFGDPQAGDVVVTAGNIKIHLDPGSASRANGMTIDFVDGGGGAFKMNNPNEPPSVKRLIPADLKAMMDRGDKFELIDVRTDDERKIATLANARALDAKTQQDLSKLDKATPLVFYCHHGVRSRRAAEDFVRDGFRNVFNLEGGIDAWSAQVDSSVARY